MNLFSVYNTRSRTVESFVHDTSLPVTMYNCGPTVYDVQHIGNLSSFVFADVIRKTLEYNGFVVKQVINITDVGHLSGDNAGDPNIGDDKMMKGLRSNNFPVSLEGLKMLSEKYTEIFLKDIEALNVPVKDILFPRATEYIQEQVEMITLLEKNGHTYVTSDGVYFDISTFNEYGELGNVKAQLNNEKEHRVEIRGEKRNNADFALWKFGSEYGWESPWGKGFPGWHIECSAMATKLLGNTIDIHTGGIEHITIHHNNEIAQSECATHTTPFVRYWMHRNHVQLDGGKISKSSGSVVYLSDVVSRGYHPSDLRYFFLQAHYRTPSNFTWEALHAASVARKKLAGFVHGAEPGAVINAYKEQFKDALYDDLNTPKALSVLFMMLSDNAFSREEKAATILDANRVLALDLSVGEAEALNVPDEHMVIMENRAKAKREKDFIQSDLLRDELQKMGYTGKDVSNGVVYSKEGKEVFIKS